MLNASLFSAPAPMFLGLQRPLAGPADALVPNLRDVPLPEARDPAAVLRRFGHPPILFWRAASETPDPKTHNAPPSIVQIKITQILDEQAQARDAARMEAGATAPDDEPVDAGHGGAATPTARDRGPAEQEPATDMALPDGSPVPDILRDIARIPQMIEIGLVLPAYAETARMDAPRAA